MNNELPSFADAQSDDDVREVINVWFNNLVVGAMDEGIDPMLVSNEVHDVAEMTKIQIHRTSEREQISETEDDSGLLDDGEHPLK